MLRHAIRLGEERSRVVCRRVMPPALPAGQGQVREREEKRICAYRRINIKTLVVRGFFDVGSAT